jgi:hypothetical protein
MVLKLTHVNFDNKEKNLMLPIPVADRSKARVCGQSLAGVAGFNPAGGMDVCVVCVAQYRQKAKARTIRTKRYG